MNQKSDEFTSACRRERFFLLLAILFPLVFLAVTTPVQAPARSGKKDSKTASGSSSTQAEVERGRYIVEKVAMCPQCHTPRLSDGRLDPDRPLDGAPEFFQPPSPDPDWPLQAPRIGGNLPASDQDMVKLLTTGIWTNGKTLRLPMMPFRMSEADARAVIAYLKSVRQTP